MSNLTWGYGGAASALAGDDFPQLAACASPDAARLRLDPTARSCAILSLRYVPGRTLRAVYQLDGETVLAARFFSDGASAAACAEARLAAADPAHVRHLPDWDAVVWCFPEDPGLPGLPAFLAQTARLAGDAGKPRLLSYLPGERCVVVVGNVVGKLQRAPGAAASHARLRDLWALPGRGFRMPRPFVADAGLGARWECFEPGVRLDAALAEHSPGPLLAAVARGLVALHGAPVAGLALAGPPEILRRIQRKVLPRIDAALPALLPRAAALAEVLAEAAHALPARTPVTIHGDLHTANVLVGAQGPIFIDLDSFAAGDPALDLALLGSRMVLSALRSGAGGEAALVLARELPEAYTAAGGAPIPSPVFAWHMAAMLLGRQVKTCLRNAAPGAAALAATLLDMAEGELAR